MLQSKVYLAVQAGDPCVYTAQCHASQSGMVCERNVCRCPTGMVVALWFPVSFFHFNRSIEGVFRFKVHTVVSNRLHGEQQRCLHTRYLDICPSSHVLKIFQSAPYNQAARAIKSRWTASVWVRAFPVRTVGWTRSALADPAVWTISARVLVGCSPEVAPANSVRLPCISSAYCKAMDSCSFVTG